MGKRKQNGSRLFFIEFLIVLSFFLFISTVCLRLFAAAHGITLRADALSHAQTTAASIAEVITAGDGTPESVSSHLPGAVISGQGLTVTYDSTFTVCDADGAFYTLTVTFPGESPDAGADSTGSSPEADSPDGHSKSALITFTDRAGEVLYELPVFCHTPLTREEVLS